MATEVVIPGSLNILWVRDFIQAEDFYTDFELVYLTATDTVFTFKVDIDASTVTDVQNFAAGNDPAYVPEIKDEEEDASIEQATSIAAGIAQGITEGLLAESGQIGKTVLAVANTFNSANDPLLNKAQITSLGAGNVMFVYASGADYTAGIIQEGPVFLEDGEVYVIQNLVNGSIITLSEGGYGFSNQVNGNDESPMPLMSLALAFKDTFFYGFRNCDFGLGFLHLVNGPVESSVTLYDDNNQVVLSQEEIVLKPWEYIRLDLNGNGEYRLVASENVMGATHANNNRFFDSRLVLPLTNDGMTWPRSGFVSALYNNTKIKYYVNDRASGDFGVDGVSPGSPADFDAITGANDSDYEPRGATRLFASGLISAYSGADSSGLEASPLCPTKFTTQKVAVPLRVRTSGDGGNNSIALCSQYQGTARLYQWNQSTGQADLVTVTDPFGNNTTEINLERRNSANNTYFTPSTRDEQNFPAAALISANSNDYSYVFNNGFLGGYIEVDVPVVCVVNNEQSEILTYRGTTGSAVAGISSDDDETLTFGITPEDIRTEFTRGKDGLIYKRVIDAGVETWEVA